MEASLPRKGGSRSKTSHFFAEYASLYKITCRSRASLNRYRDPENVNFFGFRPEWRDCTRCQWGVADVRGRLGGRGQGCRTCVGTIPDGAELGGRGTGDGGCRHAAAGSRGGGGRACRTGSRSLSRGLRRRGRNVGGLAALCAATWVVWPPPPAPTAGPVDAPGLATGAPVAAAPSPAAGGARIRGEIPPSEPPAEDDPLEPEKLSVSARSNGVMSAGVHPAWEAEGKLPSHVVSLVACEFAGTDAEASWTVVALGSRVPRED